MSGNFRLFVDACSRHEELKAPVRNFLAVAKELYELHSERGRLLQNERVLDEAFLGKLEKTREKYNEEKEVLKVASKAKGLVMPDVDLVDVCDIMRS